MIYLLSLALFSLQVLLIYIVASSLVFFSGISVSIAASCAFDSFPSICLYCYVLVFVYLIILYLLLSLRPTFSRTVSSGYPSKEDMSAVKKTHEETFHVLCHQGNSHQNMYPTTVTNLKEHNNWDS